MLGSGAMVNDMLAGHTARFVVTNLPAVARVLRNLPEFSRGRPLVDAEEFVWLVPQTRRGTMLREPVATVRLSGQTLLVECRTRHALRAMEVLLESLAGSYLERLAETSNVASA